MRYACLCSRGLTYLQYARPSNMHVAGPRYALQRWQGITSLKVTARMLGISALMPRGFGNGACCAMPHSVMLLCPDARTSYPTSEMAPLAVQVVSQPAQPRQSQTLAWQRHVRLRCLCRLTCKRWSLALQRIPTSLQCFCSCHTPRGVRPYLRATMPVKVIALRRPLTLSGGESMNFCFAQNVLSVLEWPWLADTPRGSCAWHQVDTISDSLALRFELSRGRFEPCDTMQGRNERTIDTSCSTTSVLAAQI